MSPHPPTHPPLSFACDAGTLSRSVEHPRHDVNIAFGAKSSARVIQRSPGRLAQYHLHMQTAGGNHSKAHSAVQGPKSSDCKLALNFFHPSLTHPLPPARLTCTAAS